MTSFLTRRTALISGVAAATALTLPSAVWAATTHEVQMLNKHPDDSKLRQVFYPRILVVEPGDTVQFLASNKGHNSASMKGMIPEGAEAWKGKMNQQTDVTLTEPGFYGYVCTPHAAMGMVGLVIVKGDGMMDNLEAIKEVKQRGKAKQAWEEIFAEVESMDLTA